MVRHTSHREPAFSEAIDEQRPVGPEGTDLQRKRWLDQARSPNRPSLKSVKAW